MKDRGWRLEIAATAVVSAILLTAAVYADERPASPPSSAELFAITARGRALAEYDQAAWHATDALQMANPKTAEGEHYLARKENGKWRVVYGALNADKSKFLIGFEALQSAKPREFSVVKNDPAIPDDGFYLFAARALELAREDLGKVSRPMSSAVLLAPANQLYIYLYPAPEKAGVFPFGGDVRYLISSDGRRIVEKRELHKSIVESQKNSRKGSKAVAATHVHVQSDLPEDTDVLSVLEQYPPSPAIVSTRHFSYEISTDGSITIKKTKK